jgi:hypothetical protein
MSIKEYKEVAVVWPGIVVNYTNQQFPTFELAEPPLKGSRNKK